MIIEIKTDKGLETALQRLDEIFLAFPTDPEWEERCALIDAVEAYEDRHVTL